MARKESASGQRYACDRPGCSKHYSRPDHLLRHKLNHDRERVLACDQCERTFVRQDLLARHLERHALRGKTLGRWSGKRKRDGISASSSRGQGDDDEEEELEGENEEDEMESEEDSSFQNMTGDLSSSSNMIHHPIVDRYESNFAFAPPPPPPPARYAEPNEMLPGSSMQASLNMPLRENIAPLGPPLPYQASEPQIVFNRPAGMPYNIPEYQPWQRTFATATPASSSSRPLMSFGGMSSSDNPSAPGGTALLESSVPGSSHFTFSNPQRGDYIADYDWLFDGTNPLMASKTIDEITSETSTGPTNPVVDDPNESLRGIGPIGSGETVSSVQVGEEENSGEEEEKDREGGGEAAGALHDLAFFAILQREIPDQPAFDVDASVHSRLLHFLSSVQELPTSPLFTPGALRCYLHLFFAKVNAIYPLIHRPTFSAKTADPMLLSAMVVCGAHFADEAAHFLAERIGRKLWGAFISFEDFRPARATLSMLQAMLLTEVFGKMMGTRPQHETAHLFHNFIVTLARRNAVFSPSKVNLPHDTEERWRAWSREEEKKRIALFSFLLDSQHAIIFRHIPALSSFQIHLQLPCDEDLWEAKTSEDWRMQRMQKRIESPSFISALKATLSSESGNSDSQTDSFQQFVLLHGLMSVAYDLQWKQQTLLAAPETSESISNWKDTLKNSYISCKAKLDSDSYNTTSPTSRSIYKASQSLVLWAQVALHADAVDIQIYAGLPTVLGRFIDHHTFSVARKSCREWAKTEDARLAVWMAANFLKSTLLDNDGEEEDENSSQANNHTGFDELLHHQWVQYLCALVIWAYSQALTPSKVIRDPLSRPRSRDDESNSSGTAPTSTLLFQSISTNSTFAQRVPNVLLPMDKANREASIYLTQVVESNPEEEKNFEPPHQYITGVLELVEKICRGSRWELGREASGVLRKLIRERCAQAAAANISNSPVPEQSIRPPPTLKQEE